MNLTSITQCYKREGLCAPCILLLLLAGLWTLASWYWYVCLIKNACEPRHERREAPVVQQPVEQKPVVTDAVAIWDDVAANPVVLHFYSNSDKVVEDDASAKLAALVEYMKANGDAQLMLTGHTNAHKSQVYTNQLGLTRANAVKALLVSMGAPASQIFTQSKGQTQLVGSPATAEGRYLNRRVVVSVIK